MKHTEWNWKMFLISQISKFTWEMHMIRNFLGKGGATKSDEFSEKLQRQNTWDRAACISFWP